MTSSEISTLVFPHDPLIKKFSLGDFKTQGGEVIKDAFIAYKTFGDKSLPAIVYPTWYSGAISDNEWLISKEHKSLNPEKYFIIVPALIGNSQSSSPSNYPSGGKDFPRTTMYDNIVAQHKLVTEEFKIEKLFAVVGWSMGAGQSFQWAAAYPEMVPRIVPFEGAARTAHHNIAFLRSLILSLQVDPLFKAGHYTFDEQPQGGKKVFSAIYSSYGFSQAFYRQELFKGMGYNDRDDFFVRFWEPIFSHKDANDLIHLLWTWIDADITCTPGHPYSHDPKDGRSSDEKYKQALASIKAKAMVVPCRTDMYFPPEDSEFEVANMPDARLNVHESVWGHFAGGPGTNPVDVKWLDEEIGKFFAENSK